MDELTIGGDAGTRWLQVTLWCDGWEAAEQVAVTHLAPRLTNAEHEKIITSWWFTRKGPAWRLRVLPAPGRGERATAFLHQAMSEIRTRGLILRWVESHYEPEIHAFGGAAAMDVAHDLFYADSRHVLDHLRLTRLDHQPRPDHRRELGLLLCSALMRAAGQDCYEQGDVWARVAAHRVTASPAAWLGTSAAVRRLITAEPTSGEHSPAPPTWVAAFQQAGADLADLADRGILSRGLRAVLAHHVLFCWNRAGISGPQQALLAAAASDAVFGQEPVRTGSVSGRPGAPVATVTPVTKTDTAQMATPDPERLQALIDTLYRFRMIRSPQVEAAFRAVPRHLFLPGVDLDMAYASQVVVTKRAAGGSAVSSASSPLVVASMLEQLDVQPGMRVLEIGAGTGINAALLQELAGPTGHVTTIEYDDEVAEGARAGLAAAGYPQVEVICADGADGHAPGAPYDRIIVTAGAWDLAPAWWRELATGGRLVVPLRLHGSDLTRSIGFDNQLDRLVSSSAQVCGFVPLLGSTAHAGHSLSLAADVTLRLPVGSPDEEALGQALASPAHERWTGVIVADDQPIEHLDLWLATTSSSFVRLFAGPQARENGVADPARRWAGAAIHDGGTLAYITRREVDGGKGELGVTAHGPDGRCLTAQLAEHLHLWDRQRPTQPFITAHPAGTPDDQLSRGHRIEKPSARLTLSW